MNQPGFIQYKQFAKQEPPPQKSGNKTRSLRRTLPFTSASQGVHRRAFPYGQWGFLLPNTSSQGWSWGEEPARLQLWEAAAEATRALGEVLSTLAGLLLPQALRLSLPALRLHSGAQTCHLMLPLWLRAGLEDEFISMQEEQAWCGKVSFLWEGFLAKSQNS